MVSLLVPEQTREVEVFAAGSRGDFALRLSPVAPNSGSRPEEVTVMVTVSVVFPVEVTFSLFASVEVAFSLFVLER